jgi:transcriptional regulator with XRE-family HTH domain
MVSLIFHIIFVVIMSHSFKENLRNELDYQDITVKELSVRTGIPIATLDCYLGTRATIPSVETAVKIARSLQVSVEYLVVGDTAGMGRPLNKPGREAREIIRWIEKLTPEQCRAVLKLVRVFND